MMNTLNRIISLKLSLTFSIIVFLSHAQSTAAQHEHHGMQHGFILSDDDRSGSHLVATGHHSRQVSIVGNLEISNEQEYQHYVNLKSENVQARKTYFLFQAQNLDLPSLRGPQILTGHIIESKLGDYDPQNIVVNNAIFVVSEVPINVANPFFLNNLTIANSAHALPPEQGNRIKPSIPNGVVKCHGDDRDCEHPSCAMFCKKKYH